MAEKTSEQLQKEAAAQAALAAESKTRLDGQKILLANQQADLRLEQRLIADFKQKAANSKDPESKQFFMDAAAAGQKQADRLSNVITATNAKVNSLATETITYENNAKSLEAQAQAAIQGPTVPPPVSAAVEPTDIVPVRDIPEFPGETGFGNPPIEVNIAAPPQSTSIVLPDSTETQSTPAPQAQRQPIVQIFDDGSTLTTNADGTSLPTNATDSVTNRTPKPTVPYGPSRDDEGNLLPGYEEGEFGDQFVSPNYISASTQAVANANRGLSLNKRAAQGAKSNQDARNQQTTADWRVRLSLADDQNYLYNLKTDPGILAPLKATNGVIFPYVPSIAVNYAASYDSTDVTHSNYKIFSYRQSSVDSISIACDFTAQDTDEANYLLAVIHFFKSVTKMFYGQDKNPKPGTPPPLCYLTGMGAFQFDKHPLVITNFAYTLPTDVDYIRASYYTSDEPGVSQASNNTFSNPGATTVRLPQYLKPGGVQGPPQWKTAFPSSLEPTYVPTAMQIQLQAQPIVTRNDISRRFSLEGYASGDFYRGSVGKTNGRGIW